MTMIISEGLYSSHSVHGWLYHSVSYIGMAVRAYMYSLVSSVLILSSLLVLVVVVYHSTIV